MHDPGLNCGSPYFEAKFLRKSWKRRKCTEGCHDDDGMLSSVQENGDEDSVVVRDNRIPRQCTPTGSAIGCCKTVRT